MSLSVGRSLPHEHQVIVLSVNETTSFVRTAARTESSNAGNHRVQRFHYGQSNGSTMDLRNLPTPFAPRESDRTRFIDLMSSIYNRIPVQHHTLIDSLCRWQEYQRLRQCHST
jgi:hypothetical protein